MDFVIRIVFQFVALGSRIVGRSSCRPLVSGIGVQIIHSTVCSPCSVTIGWGFCGWLSRRGFIGPGTGSGSGSGRTGSFKWLMCGGWWFCWSAWVSKLIIDCDVKEWHISCYNIWMRIRSMNYVQYLQKVLIWGLWWLGTRTHLKDPSLM